MKQVIEINSLFLFYCTLNNINTLYSHIKIGKIVATFGLSGEVIVQHNLGKKAAFKGVEAIFVEQTKNALLPFFIKSVKAKTIDESYVLFEDINSKEAAKRLVSRPVWLTNTDFDKLVDIKSSIALLGYEVYNEDDLIGLVKEVIEQPHQILLTVMYKEKEVYLPMHEDNLINVDNKNRKIELRLPNGLLEIYM